MTNKLKVIVLVALLTSAVIVTAGLLYAVSMPITPEIANELALYQMGNDADSSMKIQAYSMIVNMVNELPIILTITWLIPLIGGMVLFGKEIEKFLSGEDY